MKNKIIESRGTPYTYTHTPEYSIFSRWLPFAILISFLLHIAFLWWTHGITWKRPVAIPPPAEPAHPFRLIKPVKTQPPPAPEHLPSPAQERQKASSPKQPALPVEKLEPKPDIGTLPQKALDSLPKLNQAFLEEKPGDIGNALNSNIQKALSEGIQKDPLIQEHPLSSANTLLITAIQ